MLKTDSASSRMFCKNCTRLLHRLAWRYFLLGLSALCHFLTIIILKRTKLNCIQAGANCKMNLYQVIMSIGFFGLIGFSMVSLILGFLRNRKIESVLEIFGLLSKNHTLYNKCMCYIYITISTFFFIGLIGSLYLV